METRCIPQIGNLLFRQTFIKFAFFALLANTEIIVNFWTKMC